jgi:hypothetical protein
MPEFSYTDLLPVGADSTQYRRVSDGGITSRRSFGREFIEIEPGYLRDHVIYYAGPAKSPAGYASGSFDDKGNDFFADVTGRGRGQRLLTTGSAPR